MRDESRIPPAATPRCNFVMKKNEKNMEDVGTRLGEFNKPGRVCKFSRYIRPENTCRFFLGIAD